MGLRTLRIGSAEIGVDSDADELLCNWGDWVTARGGRGARRTGSAEGLYRSVPPAAGGVPRRIDAAAAARIEAVLASSSFPPVAAALLRHHYALKTNPSIAARKLQIEWRALPFQTKAAVDLLAARLADTPSPRS